MYTFAELLRPCEKNTRERKSSYPNTTNAPAKKKRARIPVYREPQKVNVSKSTTIGAGASQILKIAFILGINVEQAAFMYNIHGDNYIYGPSDISRPNTPDWRDSVCMTFGRCAVVEPDGSVYRYTWDDMDERARGELILEIKKGVAEENEVYAEYRQRKRDEMFFEAMQGKPSPKRQGRANSIGCVGKYVNKRGSFSPDEYDQACARLREYNRKNGTYIKHSL